VFVIGLVWESCCLVSFFFEIYASGVVIGLGFQFPVHLCLGFLDFSPGVPEIFFRERHAVNLTLNARAKFFCGADYFFPSLSGEKLFPLFHRELRPSHRHGGESLASAL
jgi:hypothetical protein